MYMWMCVGEREKKRVEGREGREGNGRSRGEEEKRGEERRGEERTGGEGRGGEEWMTGGEVLT